SCAALGGEAGEARRAIADAPGVAEALGRIRTYREWAVHGPAYNQAEILAHAERQCWTLKPAMPAADYPPEVVLGRHLNPMVPWR
ncbi:MAG: hypothetical protein H0W83_18040, partial [Planctomycetes bacterium]|nr:hypothetical protein [Planctomycetota bacterium]